MPNRKTYDFEGHVHFITFSCRKNRKLLDHKACKRIVLATLDELLSKWQTECFGFVIMPQHVHVMLRSNKENGISKVMQQWKKLSSYRLKKFFQQSMTEYSSLIADDDRIWKQRYYDFNIFCEEKFVEKLSYMHNNPVRAKLVDDHSDWQYSSARRYYKEIPVGINICRPG